MEDCVFCKIVAGQIPCYKVYEDDNFLGFLDIKPLNPGNSLLIPKIHYRWVTDVPIFGQYFEIAKKIALVTQQVVKSDYTTFVTFGTEIEHAHIRIIPRFYDDLHHEGISTQNIVKIAPAEMKRISSDIYKCLS